MTTLPPVPGVANGGAGGLLCTLKNCTPDTTSNTTCTYICSSNLDSTLSPPPPHPSLQTHMAPFLISAVCILGMSFLLLSTCTIILRFRFSRRHQHRQHSLSSDRPSDDLDPSVVDHPIWNIATVGLSQAVINSITPFKFHKLDGFLIDGSDCSVCLTEFEDGDDLRLLPKCSHAFHVRCIDTWLLSHTSCPLCRAPIVVVIPNSDTVTNTEQRNDLNNDEEEVGVGAVEGVRVGEMIRKNREMRIMSDLGENYRFRGEGVRRSLSFNLEVLGKAAAAEVVGGEEGSSGGGEMVVVVVEKEGKEEVERKGKGKAMKRSVSASSSKFFSSFRRSKSQASILPL